MTENKQTKSTREPELDAGTSSLCCIPEGQHFFRRNYKIFTDVWQFSRQHSWSMATRARWNVLWLRFCLYCSAGKLLVRPTTWVNDSLHRASLETEDEISHYFMWNCIFNQSKRKYSQVSLVVVPHWKFLSNYNHSSFFPLYLIDFIS